MFKALRLSLFKKGNILQKHMRYEDIEHYIFQAILSIEDAIITVEDNAALRRRLQSCLDQLTARQREAIFLKFYEGLGYEEVAEVMGISVKGAYNVMVRAIAALREKLDQDDFLLLLSLARRLTSMTALADSSGVTKQTVGNFKHYDTWNLSVRYNEGLFKWWNLTANGNAFYDRYQTSYL